MANGVLVSQASSGGETTWVWREGLPMAPYLATATLGRFDLTQYELESGLPVYIAIDPTLSTTSVLKKLPEIVEFYSSIYGPYPFDAVGAIVDDAKEVGYSLETQTKPVFYRPPDEATLAHELSHMWYGDSVTLHSGRTSGCTRGLPPGRSGFGASTWAASRPITWFRPSTTRRPRTRRSGHHPRRPGIAGIHVQRNDLLPGV